MCQRESLSITSWSWPTLSVGLQAGGQGSMKPREMALQGTAPDHRWSAGTRPPPLHPGLCREEGPFVPSLLWPC